MEKSKFHILFLLLIDYIISKCKSNDRLLYNAFSFHMKNMQYYSVFLQPVAKSFTVNFTGFSTVYKIVRGRTRPDLVSVRDTD